jgi:hypothetical protein
MAGFTAGERERETIRMIGVLKKWAQLSPLIYSNKFSNKMIQPLVIEARLKALLSIY